MALIFLGLGLILDLLEHAAFYDVAQSLFDRVSTTVVTTLDTSTYFLAQLPY
jgi:hypothetical protein